MLNQARISRILGSTIAACSPDTAAQLEAHAIIGRAIAEDRGLERYKGDHCDEIADELFRRFTAAGIVGGVLLLRFV